MLHTDKWLTVPQFFTQWWVYGNDPHSPSPLPRALASLCEWEKAFYLSRVSLNPKIDTAAQPIWESDLQSVNEMLLYVYHMQPKDSTGISFSILYHQRPLPIKS